MRDQSAVVITYGSTGPVHQIVEPHTERLKHSERSQQSFGDSTSTKPSSQTGIARHRTGNDEASTHVRDLPHLVAS